MKTTKYILLMMLAFLSIAQAQRKVSERSEMTPGMLQPGIDLLSIVDTSAGATEAGSKFIYPNTLFDDWGFTASGKSIAKAPSVAAMKTIFAYGSAADLNHGTAPGNLVRLDPSTGKLPALDGSLLTNLPSGTVASQAEAEAGTDNVKTMTPLRVKQAGTARIGVASGFQAWDANLDAWTSKPAPTGSVVGTTDTQTLSSKTLTSPKINLGSDATGDTYYRDSSGNLLRLGIGSTGNVLGIASGLPSWVIPPSSGGGGGGTTPSFPLVASFTSGWHNQGTRTATDTSNGLWFYGPSVQSGLNLGLLLKPITTTNWTVVVDMEIFMKMAPYQSIGLATMESSTGKIIAYNLQADSRHMRVLWPSANSGAPSDAGASSLSSVNYGNIKYDLIMKIECGSSIKWSVSYTRGATWQVIANNPVNDFITPDRVGLFMNNYTTDDVGMLVKSFVGP